MLEVKTNKTKQNKLARLRKSILNEMMNVMFITCTCTCKGSKRAEISHACMVHIWF